MRYPEISIVMATYNRVHLLHNQLVAFENQTLDQNRFEVVIVNDGSSDHTNIVLEEWSDKLKNLSFVNQVNSGPAVARNTGVAHAKGEVIAFTDDDCIVDDDWLERILDVFKDESIKVLEGFTYTNKKLRTPFTHQIENIKWNPVIPTCNAAYRKSFFEEIGGFDESFPFPHNEDTELAWRVLESTDVLFLDNMKVYHPPIQVTFMSQLKRMKMLSSEFILFQKNPTGYKKWRSKHPWITIYKEVFIKHQLLNLKFHLGFFRKPKIMFKGLILSFGWWIYLIKLLPSFIRQSKLYGVK